MKKSAILTSSIFLLMCLMSICACSRALTREETRLSYISPEAFSIDNKKDFSAPYDRVWGGIISFFTEKNISIETLAKDSGIIVAKQFLANSIETERIVDVGRIKREHVELNEVYTNSTYFGMANSDYVRRNWTLASSNSNVLNTAYEPITCSLIIKFNVFADKKDRKTTVAINLAIEPIGDVIVDNDKLKSDFHLIAVSRGNFERSFFEYIESYINQNN
jgi:hypothetical protein